MNKLINLETTNDIVDELAALNIGDQLVVDRGDYLYRHLIGMITYPEGMMMGNKNKPHTLVQDVVIPSIKDGILNGWELGKVNKTTNSVTQYNLIGMLLENGQLLVIRPQRTALALEPGDKTKTFTHADENMRSKRSVGVLAGTFTNDKTCPSVKNMRWNRSALQVPSNATKVFQILMTHTFNLAKGTSDTELTGMLDIVV